MVATRPPARVPDFRRRVKSSRFLRFRHAASRAGPAILALAFAGIVQAWSAAPRGEDPDWPCQQRLVPSLTAAAYWNAPLPESLGDWQADPEIAAFVRRLAPRRVSADDGLSQIEGFARALSGNRPLRLALIFRGLLEETDSERATLIQQLKEIGRRQRELAERVAEFAAELNAIPPDAAGASAAKRVDLQQRRDFTARNFEEIQHTIGYACELPVELDARLGAWARALQNAASR
jgi:hypothetical protein